MTIEHEEDQGDPIASISQRVGARFVDWALLMTVWLLLGAATSNQLANGELEFQRWAVLAWMALVIVYEVLFVAWRGQTPGKMLLGIKIVALRNGQVLQLPNAISRVLPVMATIGLLGAFFPIVMVFIYFSAAFMKHSRGVLDLLAGSVVIQDRGRAPLL